MFTYFKVILKKIYLKKLIFFSFKTDWKYQGEQLHLTKVSRTDMGAYLCIASNDVPPAVSKRTVLFVQCKYIS